MFEFSTQSIQQLIQLGGPVIVILMIMSVFALTIVLLKAWQLTTIGLSYKNDCENAINAFLSRQRSSAYTAIFNSYNPIKKVLAATIKGVADTKLNFEQVRDEVTRIARAELELMRSYLKALEVIATLSPLLGLLGTVLGMIKAFQQLQLAGAQVDPAALSGGIWEALITTAVGITVAIPAVIAYNWLDRTVEKYRAIMEDYVTRIFSSDAYRKLSLDIKLTANDNVKLASAKA